MPKQTIGRIALFVIALLSAAAIGAGLVGWREPTPHQGSSPATQIDDPLQYIPGAGNNPHATELWFGDDYVIVKWPPWIEATIEAAIEATNAAVTPEQASIELVPTPTSRYPTPLSEADALDWFTNSLPEERRALMRDPIARRISAARMRELFGGRDDLPPTELVWLLAAKLENPDASYPGPYRLLVCGVGVESGADVFGSYTDSESAQSGYATIEALTNE